MEGLGLWWLVVVNVALVLGGGCSKSVNKIDELKTEPSDSGTPKPDEKKAVFRESVLLKVMRCGHLELQDALVGMEPKSLQIQVGKLHRVLTVYPAGGQWFCFGVGKMTENRQEKIEIEVEGVPFTWGEERRVVPAKGVPGEIVYREVDPSWQTIIDSKYQALLGARHQKATQRAICQSLKTLKPSFEKSQARTQQRFQTWAVEGKEEGAHDTMSAKLDELYRVCKIPG
jgi:hypothetical protein